MTIREQITSGKLMVAPPGSSWLVRLVWFLIDLDLPALEEFDIEIADVIWTPADGHTISWHLGKLVSEGDPEAIAICDIIGEFMGEGHCIDAYEHGQ